MSQQLQNYNKQKRESFSSLQPSHADAWAMMEAARRLNSVKKEPINIEEFRAALRLNWRMWTIIQAELTDDSCPLPEEIKVNLLSLSNFIDKQSIKALGSLKSDDLDILITINREISAGLSATDENGEPSQQGQATNYPSPPLAAKPGRTSK